MPRPRAPLATEPEGVTRDTGYAAWREAKLSAYPRSSADLMVEIADPFKLSPAERGALRERCATANMAIYALAKPALGSREIVRCLAAQLGLSAIDPNLHAQTDGIAAIETAADGRQGAYIPYTRRALNWHTDGYYNPPARRIQAFLMHCVRSAQAGGDNALLDHEIAYLLLRDENPDFVHALMHPAAMTIPANIAHGREIRTPHQGPVYSIDERTGRLHMCFTSRSRFISWRPCPDLRRALTFLSALLNSDCPYIFRHRLLPGQGIICNNVLHSRSSFIDPPAPAAGRLLYRGRYRQPVG